MARSRTIHRCTECGGSHPRWAGRCGTCGAWNSLVEEHEERARPPAGAGPLPEPGRPVPLAEVDAAAWSPRATGLAELDRVLGGGLVPGSVTLVGGEPGVGKSTLALQALVSMAGAGARCLLVSAEESPQQVRLRAERLCAPPAGLWLLAETALSAVLAAVAEVGPEVVVVDSIQTVAAPLVGSAPGSVSQVRECADRLVEVAKGGGRRGGPAVLLVGHVTKDGTLAGPRALEHVVDTVLSFEGEHDQALRLLRATKHRFGPTGELGVFEMTGSGLSPVSDPSALSLGDRHPGGPGSVVVPAMAGSRPLLVELQALVSPTSLALPRRSAQGLDGGRLALLLAVLDRRAGVRLGGADVFVSAVGGVRVAEPAADLALALALASAAAEAPLPPGLVACGEVGLLGEIRQVAQSQRRLAEAARLGFTTAVVPRSVQGGPPGLDLVRVGTLGQAVEVLGLPTRRVGPDGRAGLAARAAAGVPAPLPRPGRRPVAGADRHVPGADRHVPGAGRPVAGAERTTMPS